MISLFVKLPSGAFLNPRSIVLVEPDEVLGLKLYAAVPGTSDGGVFDLLLVDALDGEDQEAFGAWLHANCAYAASPLARQAPDPVDDPADDLAGDKTGDEG